MNFESMIARLTRAGESHDTDLVLSDRGETLSRGQALSWAALLSSLATTESVEETLLAPLGAAIVSNPRASRYLEGHGADERRHFLLLTGYVKLTFGHEKRTPTLADRIFYQTLFPAVVKLSGTRPAPLLAAIRFYEAFSLHFYGDLRALAERDGLTNLVILLQRIEQDERRHVAGMEAMIREYRAQRGPISRSELGASRAFLYLVAADIDLRPWMIQNRRTRANSLTIGLSPEKMRADALRAISETLDCLAGVDH